ncbi:hypothetical protein ACWDRB_62080 [Nonomuraea sp. NPDC003707]
MVGDTLRKVMNATVIVALIGIVTAVAAAIVNGALATRSKTGEDVREGRQQAYPAVWELTSQASRWPRNTLTHRSATDWYRAMRQWYYAAPTAGGMYLSENARARYGDVQELLEIYLNGLPEDDQPFPGDVYESLVEACSRFRTALTEDLQSRRTRSIAWVVSRARLHRQHALKGKKAKEKAKATYPPPTCPKS